MSDFENRPLSEEHPDETPGTSQSAPIPEVDSHQPVKPTARRRRQRRRLIPSSSDERADFLEELAHRAYPTLEFFIFSLLSGAVLGASYLLDSQALLFLGILLAPLMMPWIGMVLATVTGSWRFFFQTFVGFLLGAVLIFVTGLLAGFASRIFMPITLSQAFIHARLWWPDLFVLVLGAILFPVSIIRSEDKPILPSAMLAYEFYLPLSAAAVGLGSGVKGLYPDGLIVFLIHVTLAILVGIITLLILGFRPYTVAGFTLGTSIILVAIVTLIFISGLWSLVPAHNPFARQTPTPSATPTKLATSVPSQPPQPKSTSTLVPPTEAPSETPTATLVFPTPETPTATPSPMPTPIFAKIFTNKGNGVIVRTEPSGSILTSLVNGYLVEVLPEQQEYDRTIWAHIRFTTDRDGTVEGWVIQSLLITATPAPNWQPTLTPSP
jgi:Domain of unknown function (DUF389)/Bacterial SH3 domain